MLALMGALWAVEALRKVAPGPDGLWNSTLRGLQSMGGVPPTTSSRAAAARTPRTP